MKNESLVIHQKYNAPIEKVWQAITDIEQMREWYFREIADFKPVVGFETSFNISFDGKDYLHIWKVTEVIPLKKISYEWKYGGRIGNSLVTYELVAEGNNTHLTLTHENLETFIPDTNPDMAKSNFVEGWTRFTGTLLKDYVEKK